MNEWTQADFAALSLAVDTAADTLAGASTDFGRLVRGQALGVARPKQTEDVVQLVRYANDHSLGLTVRGGGFGQSGQSVPTKGLSVCTRDLDHIGLVDRGRRTLKCGAGATFRDILKVTLAEGFAPCVVPLNLDLGVGGVMSAGGFGSTSHRFGAAVCNVASLTVVTGAGERVVAGPERERAVYDAVLGGLGRVGVITELELGLREVAPYVRTFFLHYDDLTNMISDQQLLAERVDHLEGFCAATLLGLRKGSTGRRQPFSRWSYGIQASVEHAQGTSNLEAVLAGLTGAEVVHAEDDGAMTFAARYDVRFEAMRATGAWDLAHPWFECVLPRDGALELMPQVLAMLPPFLGDGHRLTLVANREGPLSLSMPERGPWVSFAVLPMGVPKALVDPTLRALSAVDDLLASVGGRRYLSGWLFERDEAAWARHFGPHHGDLVRAKRDLDPRGVFGSMLFPSGAP